MYDYTETTFKGWPKTPRLKNNMITITEKIDGTNACVIVEAGNVLGFQSRNRLIKPGDDNFGFAFWGHENREELAQLGDGYHYGEWAGPGIQQNPHNLPEKQFFLFNTFRSTETLPTCVQQVPVLYRGPYSSEVIEDTMLELRFSAEESGYTPEGIIVYYHDQRTHMKQTFLHSNGKWAS